MVVADPITPLQRWIITIAVMTATLMQVIDTTIVNVALPHMQGSLGANPDQITWVLTSYLVSSGIIMPITGFLDNQFGRKRFLLWSIFGFVVSSALCGAAMTLPQIVIFRILQGIFGAALVPLSQAILATIYSEEERGKAMALWGIGVMLGPILGPTLGGYLTEVATWRWTFYVNVPVGLLSLFLVWRSLPTVEKNPRRMDWLGLLFLSVGIGATQYVLDRGNQDDWFGSLGICIATVLAVFGFIGFIIDNFNRDTSKPKVFDINIFKDRNFTTSSVLLAMFGLALFGSLVLLPLMLENLLDYPVLTTGLLLAPRGISGLISMIIIGKIIKKIDPRKLIAMGILLVTAGSAASMYYSLAINPWWVVWPLLLQGFGLGMIFVPLSAIAYATLPERLRAEAAGIFSLFRTIGSSIGIAIVITVFSRHSQYAWNHLGGYITPYHTAVYTFLAPMHLQPESAKGSAILGYELARQAQMVGFIDAFALITWCALAMLPFVFLIKKQTRVITAVVSE